MALNDRTRMVVTSESASDFDTPISFLDRYPNRPDLIRIVFVQFQIVTLDQIRTMGKGILVAGEGLNPRL